jgi:alpha-2-macroglobulin
MTRRTLVTNALCYLALLVVVAGFAYARGRVESRFAAQSAPDTLPSGVIKTPPDEHAKPFFSLHTSRTYATTDRARVFVNYRGVQELDFRVYRVKDPIEFFRRLDNPHQVGEDEAAEVGRMTERKPDFLERVRQFKSLVYGAIKRYVRAQLRSQSRRSFNQKFRADEEDISNRTPLNQADYARVPLLNPDQMVSSWRERLPPLEDVYDRRMISLGRREPGVYLIEAVAGDLRAYGITIVTDITTVQKTSPDGPVADAGRNQAAGRGRRGRVGRGD